MKLYTAKGKELEKNTLYPICRTINSVQDLLMAARSDHIAIRTANNRRGNADKNFESADVFQLDLDNTHSEEPEDWKTVDDVAEAFPDVRFYYVRSRNHMKTKSKTLKSGEVRYYEPREKDHIYFPSSRPVINFSEYESMLLKAAGHFPYMDLSAAKPAQPFFGVKDPQGGYIDGPLYLDQFLEALPAEEIEKSVKRFYAKYGQEDGALPDELQKAKARLFNYLGIKDESTEPDPVIGAEKTAIPEDVSWIEAAEQQRALKWVENWAGLYNVPLGRRYRINTAKHPHTIAICTACPWEEEHSMDGAENEAVILIEITGQLGFLCRHNSHLLSKGWKDFRAFHERRFIEEHGSRPEQELPDPDAKTTAKPEQNHNLLLKQYSDIDEAKLFAAEYGDVVRYSKSTGFLRYTGQKWEESDLKARRDVHTLLDRQQKQAEAVLAAARRKADRSAEENGGVVDSAARAAVRAAENQRKEIIKRRNSQRITATLTEAAPLLEIGIDQLDHNGFLLNTPGGTVDLRTGEIRPHDPADFCTKITGVSPGTKGAEKFHEFLDQFTCGDKDLQRYLQETAGEMALGMVTSEDFYAANGDGGNGKSTYFNLQYRVLGDYAGLISSDVLITNKQKNKSPELAELRGKRLVIASELEEGMRLDTGTIKKIASTDPIRAEPKYRAPFSFIPSHTIVLYTNHLPRVGGRDNGTWDRIKIIPCNARFRNTGGEIKNYTSVLFEECGEYVLSWIIEGARKFIEHGFKIELPDCVKDAIAEYKEDNDWLSAFLAEQCFMGPTCTAFSGEVYKRYRSYCESMGEFSRSAAEFKRSLENIGIKHKRTKTGGVYIGLSLKGYTGLISDQIKAVREASDSA